MRKEKMERRMVGILTILCVIALIAVGVLGTRLIQKRKEPKITTAVVTEQLKQMSDLTTSQLQYRGIIRYEEGGITFINKKSYTMLYDAQIKAGIDLSKTEVQIKKDTIQVKLPRVTVQDIVINPDTLEFYDEKNSLFNWENRQDTVKAMQLAKEDAKTRVDESALIKQAEQQAELLVKNLLFPLTTEEKQEIEIIFQ